MRPFRLHKPRNIKNHFALHYHHDPHSVHHLPRDFEPDRNRNRPLRPLRFPDLQALRRNNSLSVDDSSHQRNGLLLPIPRPYARNRSRRLVANSFSVSNPSPQPLAQDLRNHGHHRPLLQYDRANSPAFRKGSRANRASPHRIRPPITHRARRSLVDLHNPRHKSRNEIPPPISWQR